MAAVKTFLNLYILKVFICSDKEQYSPLAYDACSISQYGQ